MMTNCTYPTVYTTLGSQALITFDLGRRLSGDTVLTGTPSAIDADNTGEAAVTNAQINTVGDSDIDLEIGKAVQFLISTTATKETTYKVKITATTNSTPQETLVDTLYVTFTA